MADDNELVTGGAPADPATGHNAPDVSDPRFARLAELETYYNQVAPIIERLRPYEEDLVPLLDDEGYREFTRASRKSYYQMLKEQEEAKANEIPQSERRLLEEIDKRLGQFKPVLEDYDARAQAQTRAAKEAYATFERENLEYAARLKSTMGLTDEEIIDLGATAKAMHERTVAQGQPRFVPLEEAYKRTYGRAEEKSAQATPKSLRAKAGATGVPGGSRPAEPERIDMSKPGNFSQDMLRRLNAQRKTG